MGTVLQGWASLEDSSCGRGCVYVHVTGLDGGSYKDVGGSKRVSYWRR